MRDEIRFVSGRKEQVEQASSTEIKGMPERHDGSGPVSQHLGN